MGTLGEGREEQWLVSRSLYNERPVRALAQSSTRGKCPNTRRWRPQPHGRPSNHSLVNVLAEYVQIMLVDADGKLDAREAE